MGTPTPWIQVGAVALASYTVGDLGGDRLRGALIVLFVAAIDRPGAPGPGRRRARRPSCSRSSCSSRRGSLGDVVRQRRLEADRASRGRRAGAPRGGGADPRRRRRGAPGDGPRAARRRGARGQRDAHPGRRRAPGRRTSRRSDAKRGPADGRGDRTRGDGRAAPAARRPRRGRRGAGRRAAARRRPARRSCWTGSARPGCPPSSRWPARRGRCRRASMSRSTASSRRRLTNALRYARRARDPGAADLGAGPAADRDPRRRARLARGRAATAPGAA